MKKTTIFTVMFLFVFVVNVFAFETIPCLWHTHTRGWSDDAPTGMLTVTELVELAKEYGFGCIFFSDHGDMHINDSPDSFWWYQKETQQLNQDGSFIVLTGREVPVGEAKKANHHINAYSETSTPFRYDPKFSFDEVMDKLNSEPGIFTVFNHPWTWPEMRNRVREFSGIEIFNERFTAKDLKCYLKAVGEGWRGFAVSGSDFHSEIIPPRWYSFATWIFPRKFTKQSVLEAIHAGAIIATKNVANIQITYPPSSVDQPMSTLRIGVELKSGFVANGYNIYKGGKSFRSGRLTIEKSNPKLHYFDFDPVQFGCYVFEIPGYMVTSPFCFRQDQPLLPEIPDIDNGGDIEPTPPKQGPILDENVLRIIKIEDFNGGISITTENEEKAYSFRFYNICNNKNLLYSESGTILNCRDPLFMVYRQSAGKDVTLYKGGNCRNTSLFKASCIQDLQGGYLVGIGINDFIAVRQGSLAMDEYILITENKNVSEGEIFTACEPNGNFQYNNQGALISCNKRFEMRTRKIEGIETLRLDGPSVIYEGYFILLR